MSVFDLKPLTAKSIEDLKIRPDQLWEIKIDENIYGPFETLQLKHYARENRQLMMKAHISPMSVDDWRPFPELREFNHESQYQGPYWILWQGQKTAPLSRQEIAKRIELGTITRHDEISEDDGRHWHRIATHPEFESHFTTGVSLPQSPGESFFQKATEEVMEKLESREQLIEEKETMASFTHASVMVKEKTRTVNVEDIRVPQDSSPSGMSFWEHYKTHFMLATPVVLIAIYFAGFTGKPATEAVVVVDSTEKVETQKPRRSKKDSWTRSPASSQGSNYNRSALTQNSPSEDNYPTVIETHVDDGSYPDPAAESDQVAEIQDQEQKAEEHSLVQQSQPERDPAEAGNDQSLDATMNNEPQEQPNPAVDQPVVEEVSDF